MASEIKESSPAKGDSKDNFSTYRRLKLLGQGSFGKAFLTRDLSNNELCVMKQIHVEKMDTKARDTAVREAVALRKVRHPNVVGFRQVFVRSGWLCLVMDFVDGGDLCAAVKERAKQKIPFEESAVLECFGQCADAVQYVHGLKMVHRDIKSRNIFLCRTGRALLGDFGLVRLLESTCELAHTRVGTPYYLSPEIIRKQPYNYKTDVWSLGVLLYEMAALTRPFVGTLETLPKAILKGTFEPLGPHYSDGLRQLVQGFLNVDPALRLELRDALEMDILKAPLLRARAALQLEAPAPIEKSKKQLIQITKEDPFTMQPSAAAPSTTAQLAQQLAQPPMPLSDPSQLAAPAQPAPPPQPTFAKRVQSTGDDWIGYNTMVCRREVILPVNQNGGTAAAAEAAVLDAAASRMEQNWSVQAAKGDDSGDEGQSNGSSDSWGTVVETGIPDEMIKAAEKLAHPKPPPAA